jgi:hypothetical protein
MTLALDAHYHDAFSALCAKVDRLVYLQTLDSLAATPEAELDDRIDAMRATLPYQGSLQDINEFLALHTLVIKTNALTTNHLQIVLPFLRAIHTEGVPPNLYHVLDNLQTLYATLSLASIYRLISLVKQSWDNLDVSAKLLTEVRQLVLVTIAPKLRQLETVSIANLDRMKQLNQAQLSQMAAQLVPLGSAQRRIEAQFAHIQSLWAEIGLYADFLPGLVMSCSATNWADDERLVDIVTQSGELGVQLATEGHIANSRASTAEEMLLAA